MGTPNDRDNPFSACKKLFNKGNIRFYEFMFVIFISLFANYFVSEGAFKLLWWIAQFALLLAAVMNFQIYAKLNAVWDDTVRTNPYDPLGSYERAFVKEDIQYLKVRFYCGIVYTVEFICTLLLKRYFLRVH